MFCAKPFPAFSHFSAQGKLPHPRSFAKEMNALFGGYALEKGRSYGVILFDFASPALARQVIESN